jgi:glycosyltransferase 2 family protein
VRPAVVLGTNLVVGAAALGWVVYRYGVPATALLAAHPDPLRLVAFACLAAIAFLVYTRRWQLLIGALGTERRLGSLAAFRAAGHSVSALVPSAKLGGEPVRAFLLARAGAPPARAIASVAVDRVLDMGAAAAFACLYGGVLVRRGVPALEGALVTVTLAGLALAIGIAVTAHRLRRGIGLVTAVARRTGLDRLALVQGHLDVLAGAEDDAAGLIARPAWLARTAAVGVLANLLVFFEHAVLLAAFGLPAGPLAVVAALFASGAAHSLPVPAALGALEGAQTWVFTLLGYPPAVGLAVGLAVRLRELVWVLPGLVYLAVRGVGVFGSGDGDARVPGALRREVS